MNAPNVAEGIKAAITAVLAAGTAIFGWTGWLIIVWLICVIMDYISGTASALSRKEWSSEKARQGLWHKAGEISAILVAILCDIALSVLASGSAQIQISYPESGIMTPVVAAWYIFTELGSIIENAGELGAPIPTWLIKRLEKLKHAADEAGKDE